MSNLNSTSNISKIAIELEKTKGIIQDNIDKVIERSDKIEHLETRSALLADQSYAFHKTSSDLRREFLCKRLKFIFLVVAFIAVVVGIICWIVYAHK